QALGVGAIHQHCAIGAVQLFDSGLHGVEQAARVGGAIVMHQVGNHFGVGVGIEPVAGLFQLFAQGGVVFNNAVVSHGQVVIGNMRVGVAFAGFAVGGPAGVSNAGTARCRAVGQGIGEFLDLAQASQALQFTGAIDYRHPGGIVTTVFQA